MTPPPGKPSRVKIIWTELGISSYRMEYEITTRDGKKHEGALCHILPGFPSIPRFFEIRDAVLAIAKRMGADAQLSEVDLDVTDTGGFSVWVDPARPLAGEIIF